MYINMRIELSSGTRGEKKKNKIKQVNRVKHEDPSVSNKREPLT